MYDTKTYRVKCSNIAWITLNDPSTGPEPALSLLGTGISTWLAGWVDDGGAKGLGPVGAVGGPLFRDHFFSINSRRHR